MKATLRIPAKILALGALVACSEPYTVDENENAEPALVETLFRDGAEHGDTSADEAAVFLFSVKAGATFPAVFPSNYPVALFNKLLDGDIIEQVQQDLYTQRPLGNCLLADGDPLTLEVAGDRLPGENVWACYSPSDRTIEIRPTDGTDPLTFLPYGQDYVINLTNKIKDKKGRSLPSQTLTIPVRNFEVLSVTSADSKKRLYGASGTSLETGTVNSLSTKEATHLRILFSGSMGEPANASLVQAKVMQIGMNGMPVELQATSPAGMVVKSHISSRTAAMKPAAVSDDPRVVHVYPPQYILTKGEEGFAPGTYELQLPATVSDDGTVTGAPVQLGMPVTVRFTVQAR